MSVCVSCLLAVCVNVSPLSTSVRRVTCARVSSNTSTIASTCRVWCFVFSILTLSVLFFFLFFFLQCPERTCAATSQTNHGRLMLVARERVETRSFAMTADRYGCDFPPSTQTRKIYGILKIHVTVHRSVTENFQQRKTSKFEIPASRIIRNSREFRRRQIFAL